MLACPPFYTILMVLGVGDNPQLKGNQMKQAKQTKQGKRTRVLGLSWIERKNGKKLWEKTINGKRYTSAGDGSGSPNEHSAEVAWVSIKQKMERKNPMQGVVIVVLPISKIRIPLLLRD